MVFGKKKSFAIHCPPLFPHRSPIKLARILCFLLPLVLLLYSISVKNLKQIAIVKQLSRVTMLKKRVCYALISLLSFLICGSSAEQPNGNSTNFSFAYFSQNNSEQLIYMGNASVPPAHDYIDLTPDPYAALNVSSSNETASNVVLPNSIGRVLYHLPLTMWPASFTTVFTIFVKSIVFNGDGLAFIIVPNNESFLAKSYGSLLGLFDDSTNGNTTAQLAVEFDTYKNRFDPDGNHVGIDIQGIQSNVTADMGNHGIDIKSGRAIEIRVDYDGWAKSLQIYGRYANISSAYASIVNYTVELENTVPRSAYVGFSASTGNSYEIHRILDWNFSSVMLPESSLKLLAVGTESGKGTADGFGGWVKISVLVVSIVVGFLVSWG